MANLPLTVTTPGDTPWAVWAGAVVVDLAGQYNLPNPGEEGLWQVFATELLNVTGIAGLGVVDPRGFGDDWRAWATAFLLTAI